MIRATFADVDVTSTVVSTRAPFEVSIRMFGDPTPGVYKFLKITREPETVLVGEGDIVRKWDQSIALPPVCQQLAPLDKFVHNKRGLIIESVTPCEHQQLIIDKARKIDLLTHGLGTDDESKSDSLHNALHVKRNKYDFVFCSDVLLHVRNPLALLSALHNTLRDGGYCILATPTASRPSLSETVTTQRFDAFLKTFDAKVDNTELTQNDIKPNFEYDFNLLRAFLRFSLLTPLYAQQHKSTQLIVARKLSPNPSPLATIQKNFFSTDVLPKDVKFCPHCGEIFCKDDNCSFVYCGLGGDDVFRVGFGCGRCFCFTCGKKYCGFHYDPKTGSKLATFATQHNKQCCMSEPGFQQHDYCCGGHSSHCAKRW